MTHARYELLAPQLARSYHVERGAHELVLVTY
jgi:hypothetical protein